MAVIKMHSRLRDFFTDFAPPLLRFSKGEIVGHCDSKPLVKMTAVTVEMRILKLASSRALTRYAFI